MASPMSITFDGVKTVCAWYERAAKQGLRPSELQPSIDDSVLMKRLVHFIQTNGAANLLPPFEEPESHKQAQAILGDDFIGVMYAQELFGEYTESQLAERAEIRIRDHKTGQLLSEKTTLDLAEKLKGSHVLLATHPLSLVAIHQRFKSLFGNESTNPWFAKKEEMEKWSLAIIADPWILIEKCVAPASRGKDIRTWQQRVAAFPHGERLALPVEFAYAAIAHFRRMGKKLCGDCNVRFPVQAVGGNWVSAYWSWEWLFINGNNGSAHGCVGSCSVRTS